MHCLGSNKFVVSAENCFYSYSNMYFLLNNLIMWLWLTLISDEQKKIKYENSVNDYTMTYSIGSIKFIVSQKNDILIFPKGHLIKCLPAVATNLEFHTHTHTKNPQITQTVAQRLSKQHSSKICCENFQRFQIRKNSRYVSDRDLLYLMAILNFLFIKKIIYKGQFNDYSCMIRVQLIFWEFFFLRWDYVNILS